MPEPTLSARALNRALLARQLLLERSDLGVVEAIEQVGCLQTQYSPSGYVGLWSRLRGFRRESLTEALEERRVVQATMMRATIHMASASDYRLMTEATRPTRQKWWLRTMGRQLDGIDMTVVAEATRTILADGPRPAAEIQARLEALGYPRIAWASVGQWVDLEVLIWDCRDDPALPRRIVLLRSRPRALAAMIAPRTLVTRVVSFVSVTMKTLPFAHMTETSALAIIALATDSLRNLMHFL